MNVIGFFATMAAPADTGSSRIIYELSRLRDFDDERLPIAAIALAVIALATLVWFLYRRDTVELPGRVRILLAALRCLALAGLVVFFLGVERRITKEVVHNSQVAVLVDVSQSMGLTDSDAPNEQVGRSRLEQVAVALGDTTLIRDLQNQHDVNVARFDQSVSPVVSLPKTSQPSVEKSGASAEGQGSLGRDGAPLRLVANNDDAAPAVDWKEELVPRGTQTRLGDALEEQLRLSRGAPLAGLVVISDGAQNAGVETRAAIEAARAAKIPIYAIGVGSTKTRRNLAVSDLMVPTRAFPGDSVQVMGYLQSAGYEGQFVDVELRRRPAEELAGTATSINSQRVQLGADGEIITVSFDIEPSESGRFVYQLRALSPTDDSNPRDNARESEMVVVDRETRVLLVASGPTREYRFLRDQLRRDRTMQVDVLLQTGQPGMSQDASQILTAFPSSRDELFQYDCIVAFDPDWTQLDAAQVELLEKWIADEAGGMIVVPGPIHTAQWVRSTEHAKLRDMYPVVFQPRVTLMDDGHFGSEAALVVEFDQAGRDARFLWLADEAEESKEAWASFPGIYGYYAVKGQKPGATVYARVADTESSFGGEHPIFIAGQFYGAGQVMYLGSGEFWRLRAIEPAYFEVLYTKLVRRVSQGRLLRGSSRGSLLVDRDRYELGEAVVLRARLSNEQHEPLVDATVTAQVVRPDGTSDPVALRADADRAGMYSGQFSVTQEGTYQLALPIPGSSEEPLSKYIQARVPDLERAHPERNELLLVSLASQTGGVYYADFQQAAFGGDDLKPLAELIPSRAEVKLLRGAPDTEFAQLQMTWLLSIVAGALFLEWIIRRLNRLA